MERLWAQNITIAARLVDTVSTPTLLKTVQAKKIDPSMPNTHRFKFDDIVMIMKRTGRAASTNALKVIIEA